MNYCSDCKFYGELSQSCVEPSHVLSVYKFLRDPITGYFNCVSCQNFNDDGKCKCFKARPIDTPAGVLIFILVVLVVLTIFGIGVSIGQHFPTV